MLILKMESVSFYLLITVFCLVPSVSHGHKVRIFAYGEGGEIVGETAFSGGRVPKQSEIIVQEADRAKQLLTTRTDENGKFRFQIPEEARNGKLDLRIIVNVGEGHRGEWLLKAEEYLDDGVGTTLALDKGKVAVEVSPINMTKTISVDEGRIRQIVEDAMDKKLGPIKSILAQRKNQAPSFRDIVGGIGYLLGLAGIVAYFKSRKG